MTCTYYHLTGWNVSHLNFSLSSTFYTNFFYYILFIAFYMTSVCAIFHDFFFLVNKVWCFMQNVKLCYTRNKKKNCSSCHQAKNQFGMGFYCLLLFCWLAIWPDHLQPFLFCRLLSCIFVPSWEHWIGRGSWQEAINSISWQW